jgi:uncharacterized protein YprB with RNaseH-like and TPR domain
VVKISGLNLANLKKSEIIWMDTHYCKHGHRYTEHKNCYVEEVLKHKLKKCFFDIETSNLNANFGIMLSYCIKPEGSDDILYGVITKDDLENGILDKRIVKKCIDDLMKFDRVYGYYSTRFDIPFLRSRALYWKLNFPLYGSMTHKDVYYMARSKLKLHRTRLETVCDLLGIEGKTHIDYNYWLKALTGDKKSLDYILEHNRQDVIILEKAYNRLQDFVKETEVSI